LGGGVGSGGVSGTGGVVNTGGGVGSGGVSGTGGVVNTGGGVASGGVAGTGGAIGSGGTIGAGGIQGTGGTATTNPIPDGGFTIPDGGLTRPDGGVFNFPDGGRTIPDGGLTRPDGGGGLTRPDGGGFTRPDGGGGDARMPEALTLTINKIGAGTGTVTSKPDGISCGATCQASYAYGTVVTLAAAPDANQSFIGWDSTVCTGTGSCAFNLTGNTVVRASFSPPPNIVFTTSTTQTAALGGLAGADAICAQRAVAGGLAGTYRAWLSTSTVNAIDRLGSASGWVRPDGKPVLNNVADISKNNFFYPPRLDEFGNDLGVDPVVITGTGVDGMLYTGTNATTCGNFTSDVEDGNAILLAGWASANSLWFTNGAVALCSVQARIYCFGIDHLAQVAVTLAPGRRAFMTAASWTPGAGIGSADVLCQNEATAAKLPGTYKALLAPSGASAASRFDVSGAPWIRSDGIPLAPTASAFFSATVLDVSPSVSADGSVNCWSCSVWSGAATMTSAGSYMNCGNWLWTSGTGAIGYSGDTAAATFFGKWTMACSDNGTKLTCLQE
jgi:hypothetical protein